MALGLGSLLVQAWWNVPKDPVHNFGGKTVLVTGSNTGLGFEAAAKFVRLGAYKVILAVRSLEKGTVAKAVIEARTARRGVVEVWPLDMDSYASVRTFAKRVTKDLPRLDIAILNAGVHPFHYTESQYQWETDVQVNTLSTVLLGLLLLPKLRDSGTVEDPSYLEVVGSGLHQSVEISSDRRDRDIMQSYNNPADFEPQKQYQRSKFFSFCCTQKMAAQEEESSNVIILTVSPGLVKSDLARGLPDTLKYKILLKIFQTLFQRSTEAGSRSIVSGVTLSRKAHGQFWQHDRLQEDTSLLAKPDGPMLQEQIWHEVLTSLQKDNKAVKNLAVLLEDE